MIPTQIDNRTLFAPQIQIETESESLHTRLTIAALQGLLANPVVMQQLQDQEAAQMREVAIGMRKYKDVQFALQKAAAMAVDAAFLTIDAIEDR